MEVPEEVECAPSPHLALVLKVAGLGTTREVELPLSNYKSTIFYYVQKLLQLSCSGAVKSDKLRRIWEPTYTYVTIPEPTWSTLPYLSPPGARYHT